jgi:hypothetical protein
MLVRSSCPTVLLATVLLCVGCAPSLAMKGEGPGGRGTHSVRSLQTPPPPPGGDTKAGGGGATFPAAGGAGGGGGTKVAGGPPPPPSGGVKEAGGGAGPLSKDPNDAGGVKAAADDDKKKKDKDAKEKKCKKVKKAPKRHRREELRAHRSLKDRQLPVLGGGGDAAATATAAGPTSEERYCLQGVLTQEQCQQVQQGESLPGTTGQVQGSVSLQVMVDNNQGQQKQQKGGKKSDEDAVTSSIQQILDSTTVSMFVGCDGAGSVQTRWLLFGNKNNDQTEENGTINTTTGVAAPVPAGEQGTTTQVTGLRFDDLQTQGMSFLCYCTHKSCLNEISQLYSMFSPFLPGFTCTASLR